MTAQIHYLTCKRHNWPAKYCPFCPEIERPKTALELLASATTECMTASLNLRAYLKEELGTDFHLRYPPDSSAADAAAALGPLYRVWAAWAAATRGRRLVEQEAS